MTNVQIHVLTVLETSSTVLSVILLRKRAPCTLKSLSFKESQLLEELVIEHVQMASSSTTLFQMTTDVLNVTILAPLAKKELTGA